jgi:hypothetical protein
MLNMWETKLLSNRNWRITDVQGDYKAFVPNEEGEKLEDPDWAIIIRSSKNENCILVDVAITFDKILIK